MLNECHVWKFLVSSDNARIVFYDRREFIGQIQYWCNLRQKKLVINSRTDLASEHYENKLLWNLDSNLKLHNWEVPSSTMPKNNWLCGLSRADVFEPLFWSKNNLLFIDSFTSVVGFLNISVIQNELFFIGNNRFKWKPPGEAKITINANTMKQSNN